MSKQTADRVEYLLRDEPEPLKVLLEVIVRLTRNARQLRLFSAAVAWRAADFE